MSSRPIVSTSLLLLALTLAACGGSSGVTPAPIPVEVQAPVAAAGEGYIVGGVQLKDDPLMVVGDNSLDQQDVGILCFDLTGIGDVQSATLTFHFSYEVGDAWSLGTMRLDHIDGGGSLDLTDFASNTLTADVYALDKQDDYVLDVTALVAADIAAGRSVSTFRLRFDADTNGDGSSDFARFGTSQAVDPADWPTLDVTHVAP